MLDIIFISYNEPNADANYARLKERFPHAKRVNGVEGIANAHYAAAKLAWTAFFYVVDADLEISDDFEFDYMPPLHDANYVHIWHACNPVTGYDYGYGGIKIFHQSHFTEKKSYLDFSTTLSKGVKIFPTICGTTRFNSDPLSSFRSAYRESIKLYRTMHDLTKSENERNEAQERLHGWLNPLKAPFANYVKSGAEAGIANATGDVSIINDYEQMKQIFRKKYPAVDLELDPTPSENHPMKPEFFFTARIASALYNPYVLKNLPIEELRDALSDGQILSKNWVVEQLKSIVAEMKHPAKILILGGWIGTLSLMINCNELPVSITSLDLDERANRIAETLNYDFDFKTLTQDMYEVDYADYDIIINTSSEHIPDIKKWVKMIPAGKTVLVQNNNFLEGEGHISNVHSSDELNSLLSFSKVLYEGTRKFMMYDRYMLIGVV